MNSPAATFEVLGVAVSSASFQATIDAALAAGRARSRLAMHFATVHTIVEATRNPALARALAHGYVAPDGMPLVWLGRRRKLPVERVCGPDFMPALVEAGRIDGYRHFFYGGTPASLEALQEGLLRRFPGLAIAGAYAPPFRPLTPEEDDAVVDTINAVHPDFVWVGLGSPKQDLWVAAHRDRIDASVLLAVGAAFDFHSGQRRRAPRWMRRLGLEWLHRLASEPRRLAYRYTVVNLEFIQLLVAQAQSRRRQTRGR